MALRFWAQIEAFLDWCIVMVGIPSFHMYPPTPTPVCGQINCSPRSLCSPLLRPGGFRTPVWGIRIVWALSKENPWIQG